MDDITVEASIVVTGDAADEAAYLESLVQDLSFTRRALDELGHRAIKPIAGQPIEDVDTVAIALWHAAAIAYGRCFGTGKRMAVSRALIPTESGLLKAHQDLLDWRRSHIAHLDRAADLEDLRTVVDLNTSSIEGKVAIRVSVEGNKALLPSPAEVRTYRALIDDVLGRAARLKADAFTKIENAIKADGGRDLARLAREGGSIRLTG